MVRKRIGIVRRESGACATVIWFQNGEKQWLLTAADDINVGERVEVCLEITSKTAIWDLAAATHVTDLSRLIRLEDTFGAGFEFYPSSKMRLVVLEFVENISSHLDGDIFLPISDVPVGTPVTLNSSPYGSVNPALFLGYRSAGIVSKRLKSALLLDARFLDGMTGGEVCVGDKSLGMIIGSLLKLNGDGRLTVALEWSKLPIPDEIKPKLVPLASGSQKTDKHSVISVLCINRLGKQMWGSGVLVRPRLVLTNKHVILAAKGPIYAEGVHVIRVSEPLMGVDLVVLTLEEPLSSAPQKISAATPSAGSIVQSVGFGLFYPAKSKSSPLVSEGVVSKIYYTNEDFGRTPAIIICTASCWNGSSGGAVLSNGELIGLMSSNARDRNGEIIADMSFVIPSAILIRALNAFDSGKSLEISKRFKSLWRLETTHRELKRALRPML